jgi:hypothetical protein
MGASQSALSIQNPSQTGLRTQGDGDLEPHDAASAISTTAADEESAAIEDLRYAPSARRRAFIRQAIPLSLDLHVNATTSGVDVKALLRGGSGLSTGLI